MQKETLKNKIALVTGASRGIGAATALALGGAGAHVILGARTIGGLEEIEDQIKKAGGTATLVPLDLKDHSAIDALGPQLYEKFGKLDIFIANAGMLGTLGPLPHADAKEWDKVISVNLTANFRLIRTLYPLLNEAETGQAVFVTSGIATNPNAYWGPYAASKAGLEGLVKSFAAECVNTSINVNLFSPGQVNTAMWRQAFPGKDGSEAADPEAIARKILEICLNRKAQSGERITA